MENEVGLADRKTMKIEHNVSNSLSFWDIIEHGTVLWNP